MNRQRNGFRTVLAGLQLTAILLPAAMLAQTTIYPTPPGLGPGQTYQLLFVTADSMPAVSTNIADYNTFVSSEAALNSTLAAFDSTYGVTWTAIGSTSTVNANVNAPSSGSVYNVLGSLIATSAQPLYSPTLLYPPIVNQYGGFYDYTDPVWTGTVSGGGSGLPGPANPLGSANPGFGGAGYTNSLWLAYNNWYPQVTSLPLYALSSVITVASPPTCDPPPTGTIAAWYGFDETASPSLNLATGNSVAWSGTLTPATGEVGGALNFSAGYIDAPDSIITNFGAASDASKCGGGNFSTCQGDFSIDAWVNLSALPRGNVNVIVDKRDATLIGYEFYLYGDPPDDHGHPWLGLQLGDAAHGYTNYGSEAVPLLTANAWHHVAVTVERLGSEGTNGVIKWYLDGKPVKGSGPSVPIQTGSLVNSVPLRIGAAGAANGSGSNFNGALDEVQIFNRVLTGPEVQSIYNANSSGVCKP
jgi:hypothetical protein